MRTLILFMIGIAVRLYHYFKRPSSEAEVKRGVAARQSPLVRESIAAMTLLVAPTPESRRAFESSERTVAQCAPHPLQ